MVPWSLISFHGKPLSELKGDPRFDFDHEEMTKRVINGAWTTFKGKKCTEYGVAATGATVVRSILHDEKKIMPVSAISMANMVKQVSIAVFLLSSVPMG